MKKIYMMEVIISCVTKLSFLECKYPCTVLSRSFIKCEAINKKIISSVVGTSAIKEHAHKCYQLITKINYSSSSFNTLQHNKLHMLCRCSKTLLQGNRKSNFYYKGLWNSTLAMQCRLFSDEREPPKQISLPRLMTDFPQIAWPNIFKSIRNWVLSNFIITPYFDRDFNLHDFVAGSKQAVEFVSQCLANGDYDHLKNVIAPEALEEIKKNISRFSVQQRADLAVDKEDIYFSFPYQVGVMFNESQSDSEQQQRFVEITMCYHVLKGIKELQSRDEKAALNIGTTTEFQDKVFILNYRFIREFTKGVSGDWIVNIVNHYRPSDYV